MIKLIKDFIAFRKERNKLIPAKEVFIDFNTHLDDPSNMGEKIAEPLIYIKVPVKPLPGNKFRRL